MEHKGGKSIQSEEQKEKKLKKKRKKNRLRNLWGIFKHTNIRIIGVPEGEEEEEEQEIENKKERKSFPNLVKKIDIQV